MTGEAKIGPHNGRELELMLSGDKPLALFSVEPGMSSDQVGDAAFSPHVASGQLRLFSKIVRCAVGEGPHSRTIEIEWRAYTLPTEEWRAKIILGLYSESTADEKSMRADLSSADMVRATGALLGYTKADIELFVKSDWLGSARATLGPLAMDS